MNNRLNDLINYRPDFLGKDAADQLLRWSLTCPWQQNQISMYGKRFPLPRREVIYGDASYSYQGVNLIARPWAEAPLLAELRCRLECICRGTQFSMVIGNRYDSGSDHIGYHADDDAILGPRPAIASISLGATRTFRVRLNSGGPSVGYALRHGDLIFMRPGCQEQAKHCLAKTKRQAGPRINWTFRPVATHGK